MYVARFPRARDRDRNMSQGGSRTPSSPPPPPALLEDAARLLLDRGARSSEPQERLRCALAVANAAGDLPVDIRCCAHVQAGHELHAQCEEPRQTVYHLRAALGLCDLQRTELPATLLLSSLSEACSTAQDMLHHGTLKQARALLETLQGVLQEQWAEECEPTFAGAIRRLSAHAGVLHAYLMLGEGLLPAAARLLPTVRDEVDALPADADARAPDAPWASRRLLLLACSLASALVHTRQGELDLATHETDALLADADAAASVSPLPSHVPSPSPAVAASPRAAASVASAEAERSAALALANEARLLRASLHIARLEYEAAIDLLETLEPHAATGLTVNRYDAHPNERAHALAAEALRTGLFTD